MKFYTVQEVAKLMKVNYDSVRRWIAQEKLIAHKESKKEGYYISSEDLMRFVIRHPKYNCGGWSEEECEYLKIAELEYAIELIDKNMRHLDTLRKDCVLALYELNKGESV